MLAIIGSSKLVINQNKKTVEIRVKSVEMLSDDFNKEIEKIKMHFPDFSIYATVDNKYRIDNLNLNELNKLRYHVNQKVKLLIKTVSVDEKKTRNGDYFYIITAELPGKRKYISCKMLTKTVHNISKNKYYIIDGVVQEAKPQYLTRIPENEKALGKNFDFSIMINIIEQYDYIEDEIKKIHEVSRQELHMHTSFSKNDAFIQPKDIKKAMLENKVDTVAITDHGTVMAFLPYIHDLKELKEQGKRVLLGAEFYATDFYEHQKNVHEKIYNFESKINSETDGVDEEIEQVTSEIKELKAERNTCKKVLTRKSSSEEEKAESEYRVKELNEIISEQEAYLKNIKLQKKEEEKEKVKTAKQLEVIKAELGNTNNAERDHLTVIIRTPDCEIDYNGEMLKINPGLVELYKLITKTYTKYFSTPSDQDKKKFGRRPILPYHELFKEGVREKFIVISACAFGKHMKHAVKGEWDKFREWVKKLDAVELQPLHNNRYMINHEDYPNINSIEDVKKLHRKIFDVCVEEGVKVIFTSDAHINDKEDREFRSVFKSGYIGKIISDKIKAEEKKKMNAAKKAGIDYDPDEEDENDDAELSGGGDDDFSIETQPYILSYEDMVKDLNEQGFSLDEIASIHENTKYIASLGQNAFDMTILPKKMFLPEFPGVNVKEEVPRLAWEFAIKKWSKDGTKEGIEQKIRTRLETELEAIAKTGYEILYYVSYWACNESRKLGYDVGARGSCGSMVTTMALEIGGNNPLEPHYFCENCKKVEWVETELVGLDLPDKICPDCGSEMRGDGCNIEAHNFLGYRLDKDADLDLNFSDEVQNIIHKKIIDVFGEENVIKSGTQMFYQENALKSQIFKHIPDIQSKVKNEDFDIQYMANEITTLSSTGSHPGGLLLKNQNALFEYVTPIVYVSDNPKKAERSSCWVYHEIESQLPKIDALAQGDPGMLKELQELTGFKYTDVRFNNKFLYETILKPQNIGIKNLEDYPFSSTTMGISEMNSDFTMGVLEEIKPTTMTDMIYFSGVTHGTGSWQGNDLREKIINGEVKLQDGFPVRDIIFQHLVHKYGFDPAEAFTISESVRKGKGIKKWEKELREKLPAWQVNSMEQIKYAFPKA